MTYAQFEDSRFDGLPLELYRFDYGIGPTDFETFVANSDRDITIGGVYYESVQVKADAIQSSAARERHMLKIQIPASSRVVREFDIYPPDAQIRVTVAEVHADDPDEDLEIIWTGTVLTCKPLESGGRAELSCRPMVAVTRQAGLRMTYQYGCPYVLYGPNCKANKLLRTVDATVSSVVGNRVTLASGWNGAFAVEKFVNGRLDWITASNPKYRTIKRVDVDGRTLVLAGYASGLSGGSSVEAAVGCSHEMEDCQLLHDNIGNFGGCPWIPLENPINKNPFNT